jgi:O-antigen/teichoic acid export membrane protein
MQKGISHTMSNRYKSGIDVTHPSHILNTGKLARQSGKLISEAQSYIALVRDLVKSSGIYAISSLASPLIALVLAPFLTHELSTSDYGALVVLNTVIILVTGITQLGMISAVFRAYNYDYESRQDRLKVLSTTVILLLLTSLPVTLIFVLTAPSLADLLLGSSSFGRAVQIAALVVFVQNLSVPGLAWLRAEKRATLFSVLSILNLLIALVATVILVGSAHMGIIGAILATGLGYAFVAICTLPLIVLRAGLGSRLDIIQNLVVFGVPLVFNTLSFWVLQLSDRYLLSRLGSLAETASYGVAYSLGNALNVVVLAPFVLAWPTAMFAIAKREDAPQVFKLIFRWFSLILLLAAFALAFVAIVVLDILFPPSYHPAAPIISIIALSIVFYGVYTVFTVGTGIKRKTWYIAFAMTLAALLNVAMNVVLIPLYGSMGAALATLVAYVFLTLVMYFVNQRIYSLPFEIGIFTVALLVSCALFSGGWFLARGQTIYWASATYIGSIILCAGCLFVIEKFAARREKLRVQ